MSELLCTIWLCLLIAFLLGLLIGWLIKHFCAAKKLKKQEEALKKACENKRKADQERIQSLSDELVQAKRQSSGSTRQAQSEPKNANVSEEAPSTLYTSKPNQVDDLKEIKGIGPVLEKTLNGLGIYQFKQLADLSQENVEWVASNINTFSSRIYTDNWIEQAKEKAK